MKLIGIKGSSMIGEMWDNSVSSRLLCVCLCVCVWEGVYIFIRKCIIRLLNTLSVHDVCFLSFFFFFVLFKIFALTLPCEKFTLVITEQN